MGLPTAGFLRIVTVTLKVLLAPEVDVVGNRCFRLAGRMIR
jgi:hypothetical protein